MSFRRGLLSFAGIVGVGVVLRYTIVPDEEQLLARLSPELRAEHERHKAQRRANHDAVMAQMLESARSDRPIWDVARRSAPADSDGQHGGGGGSGSGDAAE
ncbi:assembly factor cbp4 [Coemansia biformis]|uniref:Cytochrome b mRNA-processing protein 4 n=1 Tax=Coemansia biformis TaxID=1286918 RepID=A0A9W7YAT7_9FUNG|nr:assembly factor cbp4 [Coemansia biformis]